MANMIDPSEFTDGPETCYCLAMGDRAPCSWCEDPARTEEDFKQLDEKWAYGLARLESDEVLEKAHDLLEFQKNMQRCTGIKFVPTEQQETFVGSNIPAGGLIIIDEHSEIPEELFDDVSKEVHGCTCGGIDNMEKPWCSACVEELKLPRIQRRYGIDPVGYPNPDCCFGGVLCDRCEVLLHGDDEMRKRDVMGLSNHGYQPYPDPSKPKPWRPGEETHDLAPVSAKNIVGAFSRS